MGYRFVARFSATDAALLRELVTQIAQLVGGPSAMEGGGDEAPGELADLRALAEDPGLPEDPALARLLPDAYRDDPEASGEFRRYTEQDLRAGKVAAARTVLATLPEDGGPISLNDSEAQSWMRAINDIRLALGVRLDVSEDVTEQIGRLAPDDPHYAMLAVYDWLSGTLESLVEALSAGGR